MSDEPVASVTQLYAECALCIRPVRLKCGVCNTPLCAAHVKCVPQYIGSRKTGASYSCYHPEMVPLSVYIPKIFSPEWYAALKAAIEADKSEEKK